MTTNSRENEAFCPYLALTNEAAGSDHLCPSSQFRCHADGTARAVSIHRQTASCLGSGHGKCPENRKTSPERGPLQPGQAPFESSDATVAEGVLLLLLIGMIAFGLFAIAPRPTPPPVSRDAQSATAQATNTNETDGKETPSLIGVAPLGTQLPVPTSTAVPPTRLPVRAPSPSPTLGPDRTYVVRPGDTLFSIARSLGVTVDALAKANALSDPKLLRAGQKLRVP